MDELLDNLAQSGFGVSIDYVYCGSPMYADDLALVPSSPEELQAMLGIVATYADKWQYQLNADKSSVMVLGETAKTRLSAHAHLESGTLGERRSVKLMSSTTWGFCVLCSPPPSIGPRKDAPQQEVLSLL